MLIIRSKHGPIFLHYASESVLYYMDITFEIDGASVGICHCRDKIWSKGRSRVPSWTIFPVLGEVSRDGFS